MQRPQTYQDWLNELNYATKPQEMIYTAQMASKVAPNRGAHRHDVALILAEKYKQDLLRGGDNAMVKRAVDQKFEEVANIVFQAQFSGILGYVLKAEPGFDLKTTAARKEGAGGSLGFVKSKASVRDGEVRTPLGFVGKPAARKGEGSLGFLGDDSGISGGSLGYL